MRDIYGATPIFVVVAAIRHGPSILASNLSQNITNKAVISALLLTFNYPALFQAAEQQADPTTAEGGGLFHAYFFFQMTSVLCAFAVMLSAAIFVSHVLRTGQQVDSLITYLSQALWVDNTFNEAVFIAQCLFTILAVVLYVCLNYPGTLAWVLTGLCGLLALSLVLMLLWSTSIFHATGQREWDELVAAEDEFRAYAKAEAAAHSDSGGGGGTAVVGVANLKGGVHTEKVAVAATKPRVAAGIGSDGDES
ncbi:hypothetical protein CHLRE_02g095145v5 [Chlamydomonas reinhardtii]|uniref:Uncharacterized protein n=1 Tax=Chlamydomonas reinhardtii TaxID=3055 RepID=A0A2K3E1V8_CHLRE|nr:uncharacterized protein CHLRE_02g095145v5 [Chlamydomonas reinhardtii]PNW86763.1 hypothetical protein CHLRE_02g095145v5 [Chlamydomonas reinhardtii]